MKLSIEFYASLMKYLPPGKSRFRRGITVDQNLSLKKLIEQFQISEVEAHIVLVNGLFVNAEDRGDFKLNEADVISIWPPVAGG